MSIKNVLSTFFLLMSFAVYALTIFVAPIEYYAENESEKISSLVNIQNQLATRLNTLFAWDNLDFKLLAIKPPKSFLDAIKVCNEKKLDYLLYGFIEKSEFALYGEIKLFDNQRHEIIQTFFSSDNPAQIDRLVNDLSEKTGQYFLDLFNLLAAKDYEPEPAEGVISFALGGGYWTPLTGEWSASIQSLYSVHLKVRFIPWRPAAGQGLRGFYFRTGLSADFYHALNRPGYEESDLFNFTLGIPASLCVDIGTRHSIYFTMEPQLLLDYLVIELLYNGVAEIPSFHFSASANLEYQFRLTKRFALSTGNMVLFQFMNPLRISYNPYLLFEVSLNPL